MLSIDHDVKLCRVCLHVLWTYFRAFIWFAAARHDSHVNKCFLKETCKILCIFLGIWLRLCVIVYRVGNQHDFIMSWRVIMSPMVLLCLQKISLCNKLWSNVKRRWLSNIKPCFMMLKTTLLWRIIDVKSTNCTKEFLNDSILTIG